MKNIIIGAGFSACITKSLMRENSKIIGSSNTDYIKGYIRRKNLEFNKLYQKKTYSFGSLEYKLDKATFQDRVVLGGNSDIWGGKINLKYIPKKLLNFLKKKIIFKKLSFRETGTISNKKDIYQMQNKKGEIITSSDFSYKITNDHLIDFKVKNKKLFLNFTNRKIITKNVFLCVGVIQLLDLLYRSNFLKENDIIELSEFKSDFKLKTIYSKMNNNFTIQRFIFSRAIGHYFGIQYFAKYLKLLNFIPLCIDQNFYTKKNKIKLRVKNGIIINNYSKNNEIFGKSTHFCHLKINKIDINKFLSKISPGLKGIGMAFIDQKVPGPISNDIILDSFKKIT